MKQGKVSEVVLKRSVYKNILSKNQDVLKGPGIGNDGAVIKGGEERIVVATSGVVDYAVNDKEYYTFYKCFNNLMAMGAKPISMILNIVMPDKTKEKELKEIVKKYDELCRKHGVAISGGNSQYSEDVKRPITNITMIGKEYKKYDIMKDGCDLEGTLQIVMTKAIGIEGTAIISKDSQERLRERWSGRFCDQCLEFKNYISIEKEANIARENGAISMHDVSGAGVFGAIWELASSYNMGAEIDLRKIPVWQETIEVTELFDINPYKMASQGALLIVTNNGDKLVEILEENDIPSAVIGVLVEGNDKVLINNDEKRFLEPPRGDDIYKER